VDAFDALFARFIAPGQSAATSIALSSATAAAVDRRGAPADTKGGPPSSEVSGAQAAAAAAAAAAVAPPAVQSLSPEGLLLDEYTTSPTARLEQLRHRIAVDILGPEMAARLAAHRAATLEKERSRQDDGQASADTAHQGAAPGNSQDDGQVAQGSVVDKVDNHADATAGTHTTGEAGIGAAGESGDDVAAASSLFLELQTNALARGIPGLSLILTPVINTAFKPIINVFVNMLAASVMENVQENVQARMVAQLPADVAKSVSNSGGPALSTGLAAALAGTLSKSLAASVTRAVGVKLRDSVTEAVSPVVVTGVVRQVTATVIDRLTPRLLQGATKLVSRSLIAILMRSVSHALTSTLTAVLNPLHMPPSTPEAAALRAAQCRVCAAVRQGRAPTPADGGATPVTESPLHGLAGGFPGLAYPQGYGAAGGTGAGRADLPPWAVAAMAQGDAAVAAGGAGGVGVAGGISPSWADPAVNAGAYGFSESIACFLCEKGTGTERTTDAFVTQQVAHHYAEYYSRYYGQYYDAAHTSVTPPPQEKK
jgi:hypothetical protein